MANPRVMTTGGAVEGRERNGYKVFLGVPFARAERFRPPEPASWRGVRPAVEPGAMAWQAEVDPGLCFEDCLSLNLFVPAEADRPLPIALDIHGGAFQGGSNRGHMEVGKGLLQGGEFIYVSINYRLGIWGYLPVDHWLGESYRLSANSGLLDQAAALRWVWDNAEAFGGDRERITVMGQSAGAKSVAALMAAPRSAPLFRRAVLSSGGLQCIRGRTTAKGVAERYLELLGGDPSRLLAAPPGELLAAQQALCGYGSTNLLGPVADGETIPLDWMERFRSPEGWRGKALIGWCERECSGYAPDLPTRFRELCTNLFGGHAGEAEALARGMDSPGELCDVLTGCMYRVHSRRLAGWLLDKGCPVWEYVQEGPYSQHADDACHLWGEKPEHPPEGEWEEVHSAALTRALGQACRGMIVGGEPEVEGLDWPASLPTARRILALNRAVSVKKLPPADPAASFPLGAYV